MSTIRGSHLAEQPLKVVWRPRLVAAAGCGLMCALVPALLVPMFLTPYYQTNDDIGNDAAIQGLLFYPAPLITTNVHPWFASCVRAMYAALPDWPCYRLACTCIHVAATAALMTRVLTMGVGLARGVAAAVFVLIFDVGAHLFPQFTLTACHAAGVGAIIAVHTAVSPSPARAGDVGWWVVACTLVACGVAIRFDAIFFAVLAAAPILAIEAAWRGFGAAPHAVNARTMLLRLAVVPGGVLVLWLLLSAGLRLHEPGGVDRNGMGRFHQARVAILDYGRRPDDATLLETLKEVGWSINDYKLLLAWCFADESVFTTERLELFVTAATPRQVDTTNLRVAVPGFLSHPHFRVAAIFVSLALLGARGTREMFRVILPALGMVATATAMFLFLRLPDRVMLPMISTSCAWLLLQGHDPNASVWRARLVWAWMIVALLATVAMLRHATIIAGRVGRPYGQAVEMMDRLHRDPSKKVVVIAAAFPFEAIPAWEPLSRRRWRILWLASDGAHSPEIKAQMRSMGIVNPLRAIATDPNLVTIASDGLQYGLATWALEHYGSRIRFHEVEIGPFPFRNTTSLLLALDADARTP